MVQRPVRLRRRRKWILWGLVSAAVLAGSLLIGVYVAYPRIGAWAIRSKVLPKVAARLARTVSATQIHVSGGHAVLRGVVIKGPDDPDSGPFLEIERVEVTFDPLSALDGNPEIEEVVATGVKVRLWRGANGRDNVSDIWKRSTHHGATRGPAVRAKRITATEIEVSARDDVTGAGFQGSHGFASREGDGEVSFVLEQNTVTLRRGPRAEAVRLRLSADPRDLIESGRLEIEGGSVRIWRGLSLTGIAGSINPTDGGDQLGVELVGGYGGVEGQLWQSRGWFRPDGSAGDLSLTAERFTFDRLRPLLLDSPVIDFDGTEVDASFHVELDAQSLRYRANYELEGLNLFHPMVSEVPVRDLSAKGSAHGIYDRKGEFLELSSATIESRGIEYRLSGTVALAGGREPDGTIRAAPRLSGRLEIPPRTCQAMLDGIPPEIAPKMQGFKVRGEFKADVHVAIDWSDLELTELDGSVGVRKCKVVKAPSEFDAKRLTETFTHEVWLGGDEFRQVVIGLENEDFVPIFDVSSFLLGSLMTTEDSSFYKHHGFIVREFRTALIKNLKAGYFKYGASSITMQLVKNVILRREKTLSRKFQELFFTWYLESALSKDRLLEIYINAIEYGPGIYGIGPAAKHYFAKHPRDLNPVESAFFSSILPNPKQRYRQYCQDKLNRWTEHKIARILELMNKRDRLDDEDLVTAQLTPLVFDRAAFDSLRACEERIKEATEALRTLPSTTAH